MHALEGTFIDHGRGIHDDLQSFRRRPWSLVRRFPLPSIVAANQVRIHLRQRMRDLDQGSLDLLPPFFLKLTALISDLDDEQTTTHDGSNYSQEAINQGLPIVQNKQPAIIFRFGIETL
ncbi:hypothetical protein NKJ88_31615 [Mesorhizobium sp. M0016]|uniref:hypothetical protein n=1 Tax=Mesorhizobium sp. M0016 TaxID=2956843 RepID=UPI00333D614A